MKVAYVINARIPSNNGHAIHAVRMCEGFQQAGHNTTLYCADRRQYDKNIADSSVFDYYNITERFNFKKLPYLDMIQLYNIDERLARLPVIVSNVLFAILAVIVVWRSENDICLTRDWTVAYLLTVLGFPTIFEIHKVEGAAFSPRGQKAIASISRKPSFVGLITLTESVAEDISVLGVPDKKIYIIPDAVNLRHYEDPKTKEEARHHLDLSINNQLIVYTGSCHPGKGARVLANISDQLKDATVLIIGGSDRELQSMEKLLEERNISNAKLVGRVSPTRVRYYQWAADVLVVPPTKDESDRKHHPNATSPLKMFEYMAAGRPIVASKLPGISSVLTHEEDALLVPPGDESRLVEAINRVLKNQQLANKLSTSARENVTNYTWSKRAERIVSEVVGQ